MALNAQPRQRFDDAWPAFTICPFLRYTLIKFYNLHNDNAMSLPESQLFIMAYLQHFSAAALLSWLTGCLIQSTQHCSSGQVHEIVIQNTQKHNIDFSN